MKNINALLVFLFLSLALEAEERLHCVETEKVLPVVLHIVGSQAENPLCPEQISIQFTRLHRDFLQLNDDFLDVFSNGVAEVYPEGTFVDSPETCNSFALAKTNHPTGSGLEEGQCAVIYYQLSEAELGLIAGGGHPLNYTSGWDPATYVNIWIVPELGNSPGYSTLPVDPLAQNDGIVITYCTFGIPSLCNQDWDCTEWADYNFGRTLVHLMGHYLGLKDVFCEDRGVNGSTDNPDCSCNTSLFDTPFQVEDVPIQAFARYGCPDLLSSTSCNTLDMHMNFMDNTADACRTTFTADQLAVMNMVTNPGGERASLVENNELYVQDRDFDLADCHQLIAPTCPFIEEPGRDFLTALPCADLCTGQSFFISTEKAAPRDQFRLKLIGGDAYQVDLCGIGGNINFSLQLFDLDGNLLAWDNGSNLGGGEMNLNGEVGSECGSGALLAFELPESGEYLLQVNQRVACEMAFASESWFLQISCLSSAQNECDCEEELLDAGSFSSIDAQVCMGDLFEIKVESEAVNYLFAPSPAQGIMLFGPDLPQNLNNPLNDPSFKDFIAFNQFFAEKKINNTYGGGRTYVVPATAADEFAVDLGHCFTLGLDPSQYVVVDLLDEIEATPNPDYQIGCEHFFVFDGGLGTVNEEAPYQFALINLLDQSDTILSTKDYPPFFKGDTLFYHHPHSSLASMRLLVWDELGCENSQIVNITNCQYSCNAAAPSYEVPDSSVFYIESPEVSVETPALSGNLIPQFELGLTRTEFHLVARDGDQIIDRNLKGAFQINQSGLYTIHSISYNHYQTAVADFYPQELNSFEEIVSGFTEGSFCHWIEQEVFNFSVEVVTSIEPWKTTLEPISLNIIIPQGKK